MALAFLIGSAAVGCALKKPPAAPIASSEGELRAELAALRARTDDLERKVATLGKRVGSPRSTARSIEQRLAPIEDRLGLADQGRTADDAPRATGPPRAAPSAAPSAAPELDVDGLQRELSRDLPSDYRHGLMLVREGAYEQAIPALREFVRARNGLAYLAGAQYWIGQAYMQLGQFYQAILAFTEVQQRFARGDYAPAAGFASGVAFLQLGNASEARRAFEKVTVEYPGAPEAAKARARLTALADRQA